MTRGDEPGPDADRDTAAVARTYDRIAEHFAETREYPWPEVTAFLDGRAGTVGLDVGCGNGRHLEPLHERVDRAVGVDVSRDLLSVAVGRACERGYADGRFGINTTLSTTMMNRKTKNEM